MLGFIAQLNLIILQYIIFINIKLSIIENRLVYECEDHVIFKLIERMCYLEFLVHFLYYKRRVNNMKIRKSSFFSNIFSRQFMAFKDRLDLK